MIISENGTLFLNNFTSIVSLPNLVELTQGVDYTLENNDFIDSTILSSTEILLATPIISDCEQGSSVLMQIDDFLFKNIIDNIDSTNKKIILLKDIINKDDEILDTGSLKIKVNSNYIVKLNNVKEGNYLIKPTNQKLIVRKSWIKPFVNFEDLSAKLVDIDNLKESRLSRLNKTALKFIYSDLK